MENQGQRENASTENNVNNDFSNTNIHVEHAHLGIGSNINQSKELKEYLKEKIENNRFIEQVNVVADSELAVKYVPLQMVRVNEVEDIKEDIRNAREEINTILKERPDDELKPETFFKLSKQFAETSKRYESFADKGETYKMQNLSNLVFVIGHAGIGKTCLTKRYLQLFLNNKISSDYLFYIKFRDVDYEKKINLMTFLTGDDKYENYDEQRLHNLLQEISNNDNVTLVLDGFDQAKLEIDQKAKAQDFILGLLNGKILCKSKKLVTSRPKQLFDLPKQYRPLFIVKLLGINKNSQKQICENICGDDFESIFKKIQSNSDLSNYCGVPLICITIVYCIYKYLEFEQKIPSSLTEIFFILICMYLKDPTHTRGKLPFENLCKLAFNGILDQKLFFNQNDLKKVSLNEQDQNNFTLTILCKDRTHIFSNVTLQYTYFSHLIVQEWFAALYLMLYAKVEEFNEVLFSKNCKIDLRSTNFNVFVSFLFGLGNEQMFKKYYQHRYFPDKIDPEIYSEKLNLLKNYLTNINGVTNKDYEIISWLYELKDDEVARLVADKFDDDFLLSFVDLPQNIILPLNYVLRCTGKNLQVCVNYAFEPSLF